MLDTTLIGVDSFEHELGRVSCTGQVTAPEDMLTRKQNPVSHQRMSSRSPAALLPLSGTENEKFENFHFLDKWSFCRSFMVYRVAVRRCPSLWLERDILPLDRHKHVVHRASGRFYHVPDPRISTKIHSCRSSQSQYLCIFFDLHDRRSHAECYRRHTPS